MFNNIKMERHIQREPNTYLPIVDDSNLNVYDKELLIDIALWAQRDLQIVTAKIADGDYDHDEHAMHVDIIEARAKWRGRLLLAIEECAGDRQEMTRVVVELMELLRTMEREEFPHLLN